MKAQAVRHITGHNGAIYDVLFAYRSNLIYTTSADKYVTRWNIQNGTQDAFAIRLEHAGFRIALSEEHNLLAIGNSKGGIHVIDLNKNKEIRYITQHRSSIFSLSYNPYTSEFYSGDADGTFCVWDAESFDYKIALPFNCGKIRSIAIEEKGERLAISGQDGYIRILETHFFNEINSWKAHSTGVNVTLFDGKQIISGGKNAYLSSWNLDKQQLIRSIPGHNYAVYDLISLNDGALLVSCSFDKTIKLWNKDDLTILQRLERKDQGHLHVVNRLAKVSESSFLSVSDDRNIILWSLIPLENK